MRILLLTDLSSGYSRSLLRGVVRYANEVGPWFFYRMPIHYRELHGDEGVVEWAKQWKADAIIAQLSDINVEILNSLEIPLIVQNYRDRFEGVSNLTGDYYQTGVMAAEFFMKQGFHFFAYYGFQETVWMRERGDGFRDTLDANGMEVFQYQPDGTSDSEKWSFDIDKVSEWIVQLPKPIAIFACDDYHALQITEVCKMADIDVPFDVAVLGVDNDELLCNISNPPLSSIELDIQSGGYDLGKFLHELILKKVEPGNIIVKPLGVVQRKSTDRLMVSKHVKRIIDYIQQNYIKKIGVTEMEKLNPISRRVLEKLFKRETGKSIYQYLQYYRTERFAELLANTDVPIADAALQVGFSEYKNIFRIFTKAKKITPQQYRKRFGKTSK